MKQVTTITLQFKLTHGHDSTIGCIRSLINKLREYNTDGEVEVVTNDDTGDYTFIVHDGKYSYQFTFKDIDTFVKKYAKHDGGTIASVLSEYGKFVDCESTTEEVKDESNTMEVKD
jgi:hypothetical protein